jgi:tetratricopeptide (TPR) repeat protein
MHFYLENAKDDILKAATYLAEKLSSTDGYAEAMKTIVPLYLEKNEVDLAAELADNVHDPFVRDYLLMLVAEKCSEIDDDEYALQISEAIDDKAIQVETLEKIALRKIEKGSIEKALKIAEMLYTPERIFKEVALKYAENGNVEKAKSFIEQILIPSDKVLALQSLSEFLLKQNKTEEALQILNQACDQIEELDYEADKIRTLEEIANLFIRIGQKDKAIELLEKARQKAEKLEGIDRESLLSIIALGFLNAGSLELADRTLDLISDKIIIASTLISFARYFYENGESTEALDALEEAYQIQKSASAKEIRSTKEVFQLLSFIAVEFAKFGKGERAIEIAQQIGDENEQFKALSQIAQVFALQNKNEMVDQAIKAINQEDGKLFALIAVSDASKAQNRMDEALNSLQLALELVETVPQLSSRVSIYNEIAERFLNYGQIDKAREILLESIKTAALIRDESLASIALALSSKIYEKAGFTLNDSEKNILYQILSKQR